MIPCAIETISKTVASVVTTADAKSHLRVDTSEDDTLIDRLVLAAIEAIESKARTALVPQTVEIRVPRFPNRRGVFRLPRSPVRSVTSIKYLDDDGVEQTLDPATYAVEIGDNPARVYLADANSDSWPTSAIIRPDAVRIRYEAGPATAGGVSDSAVSAILLMVGTLYENRQGVVTGTIATKIPDAVDALLMSHKIPNGEIGVVDS